MRSLFDMEIGESPVVAIALHDGHTLRPELLRLVKLSESERLRKEEPFTGILTGVSQSRITVNPSRFEVDLDRPRPLALALASEENKGRLWSEPLSEDTIRRSLMLYDDFYDMIPTVLDDLVSQWGGFVILDLHSYNHRRGGPHALPGDPTWNPDIRLNTFSLPARFHNLAERVIKTLGDRSVRGRPLDVRESTQDAGHHFAQWVHDRYSDQGCVLTFEIKKIFMDEWTGEVDADTHGELMVALKSIVPILEQDVTTRARSLRDLTA